MQAAQGHFDSVHLVADVLAGLAKWHDALVVKLTDRLLEVVRRSMENLKHRDPQVYTQSTKHRRKGEAKEGRRWARG